MTKLERLLLIGFLVGTTAGCDAVANMLHKKEKTAETDESEDEDDDSPTPKKKKKEKGVKVLADIQFRPERDGFKFQNTGGEYPKTKPVLDENVVVRMFGKEACVDGDTKDCTLTLPALEWAHSVNRAMNAGQCEGMAVSSLTFYKGIDKPDSMLQFTAHAIDRKEATPLIAYYWAYQTVDPVMTETIVARRNSTPVQVEDKLVEMFKNNELATLAFWNPNGRGGHAVTPYAVEDRGNGIHWIKVYDNNFPEKERVIVIDRNANTWKYDLAALNPDQPKMPWYGGADSHNLAIRPLNLRLGKAVCPFCREGSNTRTVWPRSTSISITDPEGRRVAVEGDKIINEIPNAQVIDVSAFLEGYPASEPIFVLPDDADYDVKLAAQDGAASPAAAGDDAGVTVFGRGNAISVEGTKLDKGESDTLGLVKKSSDVRYRSGNGKVPALKLAVDDDGDGAAVRVANLKADKDDEIELVHDRKAGRIVVQGGGKATTGYDLEVNTVKKGLKGVERSEQKGVRFKLGESHAIDARRPAPPPNAKLAKPGAAKPPKISRGVFLRKPKPKPADPAVSPKESGDKDKPTPLVRPGTADPKRPTLVRPGTAPAPAPTPAPAPKLKKL